MTTLGALISDPALGIDTARWQDEVVPFAECAELGVRFASIKWFDGPWRAPSKVAERQYSDAKAAGLLVGRYAWWLPAQPVEAQVAAWCAWSSDDDLPLCIDAEDPGGSPSVLRALEDIVQRVRDLTGRLPMIYSGSWWADARLGATSEVLAECPYWHAAYPRKLARGTDFAGAMREWLAMTAPTVPRIWHDRVPVAWQLDGTDDASGTGALRLPNGIDVDVDLADWNRLRALVPALADTDPPTPFDPRPPALREEPTGIPSLTDVLRGLSTTDTEDIT